MSTFNPNHTSILDTPSGHIGPVIFYTWKGIGCVRSMPQHYHDARTTQQLQNRSKLTILMAFQSKMKDAIRNGYQHTTHDTTELNEATRINYRTALTTQGTTAQLNYPNTYLSWGSLPRLANLQYLLVNHQLSICWDTQISLNPNDQVHIALYNQTRQHSQYHPHCATRHDQGVTIPIPQTWQHDQVHLWIWLSGSTQNSTSQYLGTLPNPSTTPATHIPDPTPTHQTIHPHLNPHPTRDSQAPKCYQTAPSLGPGTHQKPDPNTPAKPPQ